MIIGLCILVIGVILLVFGYNQTQSLSGEVGEALTGKYSDETMLYLILGAVGVIAGLAITFTGGKR
jgi:drug/metabolite transporter (DMT)-like permease